MEIVGVQRIKNKTSKYNNNSVWRVLVRGHSQPGVAPIVA